MKKHGNLKSFILGVLATVMVLGLVLPASASVGSKSVELYYNNIKIRLNGQEIVARDANGNAVEPFIIDGTTYLPVRGVASALGLNVSWDGATQTVILGDDPQNNQPAAWLGDLEPFEGSVKEYVVTNQQYDGNSTANNGDTFERCWGLTKAEGASFLLKGQYTRLTGSFYQSSYAKNDNTVKRILVYSDDNLIYTSPEVGKGVEPIDLNINVSNCYKLTIVCQTESYGNWNNSYMYSPANGDSFFIGNAALWTK